MMGLYSGCDFLTSKLQMDIVLLFEIFREHHVHCLVNNTKKEKEFK